MDFSARSKEQNVQICYAYGGDANNPPMRFTSVTVNGKTTYYQDGTEVTDPVTIAWFDSIVQRAGDGLVEDCSQQELEVLKEYVDARDRATYESANAHSDAKDTATLAAANTYTDSKATATLEDANAHSDAKDTATLAAANTYTDSKATTTLAEANAHSDANDATTLASANTYTDNKTSTALEDAKAYSDAKDETTLALAHDYTDSRTSEALADANAYSDENDATILASANAYTDNKTAMVLSDAVAHSDANDAATLASAKTYADGKAASTLADANAHSDANDVNTLSAANAYTDSKTTKTYANVVYVNSSSPASASIFDKLNPPATNDPALAKSSDNLYIGSDGSTWVWDTALNNYITKAVESATAWTLANVEEIDALGNKEILIQRKGGVIVGNNYYYQTMLDPTDYEGGLAARFYNTSNGSVSEVINIARQGKASSKHILDYLVADLGLGLTVLDDKGDVLPASKARYVVLLDNEGAEFHVALHGSKAKLSLTDKGLGINNHDPQYALDVVGNAKISYLPSIENATRMVVIDPTTNVLSQMPLPEPPEPPKSTNKRFVEIQTSTSITLDTKTTDVGYQNNTQVAGTLTINAPTGTPTPEQRIEILLRSAAIQTFAWNSVFLGSSDLQLPTASTGSNKFDRLGFSWCSITEKWHLIAKVFGF
jgi:hypothetical protein